MHASISNGRQRYAQSDNVRGCYRPISHKLRGSPSCDSAVPTPPDFHWQIDRAAERLQNLSGDFIFVGASPIYIGLQLLRLAPDRNCHFVPFSGGWMREARWDDNTIDFERQLRLPLPPTGKYLKRVLPDFAIENLLSSTQQLNIVDSFHSGSGQVSFADLLMETAHNGHIANKFSGHLRLVSLVNVEDNIANDAACRWPTRQGWLVRIKRQSLPVRTDVWNIMVSKQGITYHCDDPRLTEPYRPEHWHAPPQPARPSNIAAFRRAAQGIAPERLRAAGLSLPG